MPVPSRLLCASSVMVSQQLVSEKPQRTAMLAICCFPVSRFDPLACPGVRQKHADRGVCHDTKHTRERKIIPPGVIQFGQGENEVLKQCVPDNVEGYELC